MKARERLRGCADASSMMTFPPAEIDLITPQSIATFAPRVLSHKRYKEPLTVVVNGVKKANKRSLIPDPSDASNV